MPKVPSVGLSPSSRPQFSAPGVVSYDGSAQLQSLEQEGVQKQRVGSALQKISNEIEDKVNDARALEASNYYEAGVNGALLEYRSKKGKDAVNARADLEKFIEEQEASANAMLANDFQRSQFGRVAEKVKNRTSLHIESHYMEAAAQDKQQQIIARRILLGDNLASMDLTMTVPVPGNYPTAAETASTINPEALVEFGQINNLLMQEGEAKGLSGTALEVWAMGQRDELFESIVTRKLDSEDIGQVGQVEALMEGLPEGVISQSKRHSLSELIDGKSRDSQAIRWAAQGLKNDISYADGIDLISEKAKDDPQMAEAWLDKWNKFTSARDKAESETRGNLMRELSDTISRGESLSADDIVKASEAGIYYELRLVEARLDITDDYGKRIVNKLYRNPQAIAARYGDDEGTIDRMTDQLKAHVSQETLRVLSGQYNAFKSEQTGSETGSKGKTTGNFNPYTATHTKVTDLVLLQNDALANADSGRTLQKNLEIKYGKGESATRNLSRKTMMDRFHVAVMTRANVKWQTLTAKERETTDELVFLQEVSKDVYESGWVDQEHTKNIYTTEFQYGKPGEKLKGLERPMRPDELEPYQKQAQDELIQEERSRAVQEVFDQLIPGNLVLNRQELESQASKEVLGIPGGTISKIANIDAARARAKSRISPADIDARAETLRAQELNKQKQKDVQQQSVVMRSIARSLLTQEIQSIELPRITDAKGVTDYKGFQAIGPSGSIKITSGQRMRMFLDQLQDLEKQWGDSGMNPDNFEDFALMFYPGSADDLPKSVKAGLRNIPRSTSDPNRGPLSRHQALKLYFVQK